MQDLFGVKGSEPSDTYVLGKVVTWEGCEAYLGQQVPWGFGKGEEWLINQESTL